MSASTLKFNAGFWKDPSWWSWSVMIGLIAMRFSSGRPDTIYLAVGVCAALIYLDLVLRDWDFAAMSVQTRSAYALLLLAGLNPWLGWIHVVQIVSTGARALIGFCLLGRVIQLASWNRRGPLNVSTARRILLAAPGGGGILRIGPGHIGDASPCTIGGVRAAA